MKKMAERVLARLLSAGDYQKHATIRHSGARSMRPGTTGQSIVSQRMGDIIMLKMVRKNFVPVILLSTVSVATPGTAFAQPRVRNGNGPQGGMVPGRPPIGGINQGGMIPQPPGGLLGGGGRRNNSGGGLLDQLINPAGMNVDRNGNIESKRALSQRRRSTQFRDRPEYGAVDSGHSWNQHWARSTACGDPNARFRPGDQPHLHPRNRTSTRGRCGTQSTNESTCRQKRRS